MKKMNISDLDIFDINMVHQMQYDAPPKREQSLFKLVSGKLIRLIKLPASKPQKATSSLSAKKGSILFFGASKNNQKAFQPVYDCLDENEYRSIKNDNDYPMVKSLYLSLPYLPALFKAYRSASPLQRKLIKSSPLAYLFAYGKMKIACNIISDYAPKLLVMANDHSPMNRCLLHASAFYNVKTLYLQHASVTPKFPKLIFDYAFLDGLESFEIYGQTSKPNSKVLLTGATRYDSFYFKNELSEPKKIGISINQFDEFDIVKELCLKIAENKDLKVIVRPHPNMVNWNKDWFLENGIEYSDSSVIPSNQYLASLKLQISNACGIHLDAAILGIPTVQFQLSKDEIENLYQYVEKGLVRKIKNYAELEQLFNNQDNLLPDPAIIQYFMASYKTELEGNVGKFTAAYIKMIFHDQPEEAFMENYKNIKVFKF